MTNDLLRQEHMALIESINTARAALADLRRERERLSIERAGFAIEKWQHDKEVLTSALWTIPTLLFVFWGMM